MSSLVHQTIVITFCMAMTIVFGLLLALYHKDTYHRWPQIAATEENAKCSKCTNIELEDKFCSGDFVVLIKIKSIAHRIPSLKPGQMFFWYSAICLKTFRMNLNSSTLKTPKEKADFRTVFLNLTSSSEHCSFKLEKGSEYVVSGKIKRSKNLASAKATFKPSSIAVLTSCDLIMDYTTSTNNDRRLFNELSSTSDLCSQLNFQQSSNSSKRVLESYLWLENATTTRN